MPLPQPPSNPTTPTPSSGKRDGDIVVIPEKFYGVALKMDPITQFDQQPVVPPPAPKPVAAPVTMPVEEKKSVLPMVVIIVLVLLLLAGGFVYFARDLLFPPATPVVQNPTPVQKDPPTAPTVLTARASGSTAASLQWTDASTDETGYRVERKQGDGTFLPVTSLPANSATFLDVTAQAGTSYSYRVIAIGEGGESLPSPEATVTLPELAITPPPGPTLPPGGLDSDSDGLSNTEEALFGTDANRPDSDGDNYLDGNEVFHLYNPQVKAPSRILDSELVKALTSPVGWTMFVPSKWTSSLDTPDGSRATLTTETGEQFLMSVEDNLARQPLLEWYLAKTPGVTSTEVRSFTTKGGLQGIFSPDRLQAMFAWEDKVFVLKYTLGTQTFVNYRTTFEMMMNSLTLNGAPKVSIVLDPAVTGPGTLLGTTSTEMGTDAGMTVTSTEPAATSTEAATSSPSTETSVSSTQP